VSILTSESTEWRQLKYFLSLRKEFIDFIRKKDYSYLTIDDEIARRDG
jgi:hypothetical protein